MVWAMLLVRVINLLPLLQSNKEAPFAVQNVCLARRGCHVDFEKYWREFWHENKRLKKS